MRDPELRAAEEELRQAQKNVQAALLRRWAVREPDPVRRLLAFLPSAHWGAMLGLNVAAVVSAALMNRSLPDGYRIHSGLEWVRWTFILALLTLPVVMWLKVPLSRFFVREFLLGALVGFAPVCFLTLRDLPL